MQHHTVLTCVQLILLSYTIDDYRNYILIPIYQVIEIQHFNLYVYSCIRSIYVLAFKLFT